MTKKITLSVKTREEKVNFKEMRKAGEAPAVLYGKNQENQNLSVQIMDLEKAYSEVGSSHLIDLAIAGKEPVKALIKAVQKDPLKDSILHADFYLVDMNEKLEVETPLHFVGESKAVKEMGGTLIKSLNSLLVRCLPGDLLDSIEVDLSILDNFDASIKASDLKLPANSELITQSSALVAAVIAAEVEEEKVPEPVAAQAAPSVGEKDKKENAAADKK